ncbi:putative quinol monooxygenase [Pedobacter xixiisoli]|uniref:Quinol monooxygenase YgiN n=2 Tax=Pedobacter xixiisoli TaxID=1476464 RepID=A0A286A0E6_9SPHI|nr:antibiotic biosynthesis monooxygenase [Pedobacter xixiisoli]SOD15379.1 Quinol monooxygenase YgiN [Pedobacter xixiisoli]
MKFTSAAIITLFSLFSYQQSHAQHQERMIRIAKIEVHPEYLEEYKSFLTEEIKASLTKEPGVLTLYAMHEKDEHYKISILEVYANTTAYEAHIKTPHFLKYKTGTLKMIKSLELLDMSPILFEEKTKFQNKTN